MRVNFNFTDSPRGSLAIRQLIGVAYSVNDSEGNLILQGEGGIHELSPGQYCIDATKYIDDMMIYFAQQSFEVPTEIPEDTFQIIPPPPYDLGITVYMVIIPIIEKEEVPCPEMWDYEDDADDGGGGGLWLLILIGLLILGGV